MTHEEREAIRQIFREEIRTALVAMQHNEESKLDAEYLASLPPAERKARLKLQFDRSKHHER